jgi:MFS family permease
MACRGATNGDGRMRMARGLVPTLPRAAWTVLAGDVLSSLGTGLTLPFLVVYLHRVRGIALEPAVLAMSVLALAGFLGNPIAGLCSDRFGARNALIGGLLVSALGAGALALVRVAWEGLAAAAVVGLGAAVVWPAQDALLASVVAAEHRAGAFSLRYATMNAALGAGALGAAALVDVHSSASFAWVYMLDAVSFLAFVPILLRVGSGRSASANDERGSVTAGSYRLILRDGPFVGVWLLTALLVTIGYAQMDSVLPVFATRPGGITAGGLAVAFAANTFTVVIAQLVVLRLMRGRRRSSGLVILCGLWAGTWALVLAAGRLGAGGAAVLGFAAANVTFALGETLVSPTLPAIVNDLAPDPLRGRYNGAYVLAWTTGFASGPVIAGVALAGGYSTGLFLALIGVCGLAALASVRLGRMLPAATNLLLGTDPVEPAATPVAVVAGDGASA